MFGVRPGTVRLHADRKPFAIAGRPLHPRRSGPRGTEGPIRDDMMRLLSHAGADRLHEAVRTDRAIPASPGDPRALSLRDGLRAPLRFGENGLDLRPGARADIDPTTG